MIHQRKIMFSEHKLTNDSISANGVLYWMVVLGKVTLTVVSLVSLNNLNKAL